MDPVVETASDTGFDVDSAVNDIGGSLGFDAPLTNGLEEVQTELPLEAETETPVTPPVVRQPPKSWAKEKHELWGKLPPDAQEYYEVREKQFLDGLEQYKGEAGFAKQMRDIITPYAPVIHSQGVTEAQAVQYLLNAHYRLSTGTPEQRQSAYQQIGRDLGILAAELETNTDPVVRQLQNELNGIKSTLSQRQQMDQRSLQADVEREVDTFKANPLNVHFDEVGQDMVVLINAGHTLKDAYEKAVWANPVTRQKELTRLQTEEAVKLKEKAKTEAETARKATSSNMRGLESRKAPTEPLGSMEETMRETLGKIKNRAH